ncbi:hydantoinase B/oxoprolinase family protein [Saccharopolyspora sp. ASAGF58]|uniref:hydantoinase B/oxoprolinase family protein n=1 Tax=Saccharopolyspora sp. ASAGF58 TaxID=2719023 RepID=UPI00143FE8C0|nr:hydantoinase B/oxoprolinase family protein [Saccharopolyspora sp. ASAGF58]QIZ38787.1 hydantoinase B/oxoprolinase family protein [Saccharopolyspora sp. ASAGF58]
MRSSPVWLEILAHRFSAVVEEMAETIRRTSFSTFVKQTADFGTCLVTPEGELFAAPRRISGNTMIGVPAGAAIRSLGEYRPGDVGISNDPDSTGGLVTHLPDLWTWCPLYAGDELIAFALSFVHSSDIGGSVPSSIDWGLTDQHQEGLLIPPVRLIDDGRRNDALFALIARNSRVPRENIGDIEAQIAALRTAQRRIGEIHETFGAQAMKDAVADLLDTAESRAGDMLGELADGTYEFVDYLEGAASVPPTRLRLALTISGRTAHLSFEGTSPQVVEAINLHTGGEPGHYMLAFALVNWFYSQDKSVPYNSGLVRPLTATLPPGSVVNPHAGATCGVRAAVFFRIMDCVLGCLAQAAPDAAMAAGAGAVAIAAISHRDPVTGRRHVSVGQPLTGGSGGRPGLPGLRGTSYMGGWLRNVPNEVLEAEVPVLVEQYRYRRDSGGSGAFPGGDGLIVELRSLDDNVTFAVRGLERLVYQPWGVRGGGPGQRGRATLNPGTPDERDLGRVRTITLNRGDVLRVETPGGGGLGERPPGEGLFTLGEARETHDRRWPGASQRALIDAVLGRVPPARQATTYRTLYLEAERRAADGVVTEEIVHAVLEGAL